MIYTHLKEYNDLLNCKELSKFWKGYKTLNEVNISMNTKVNKLNYLSYYLSIHIYLSIISIYICLSLKAEDKINWTNIKEEMGFNLLLRVVESLYNGYGLAAELWSLFMFDMV